MSKKRLKTLRTKAFYAQAGRCFYCCRPMWLSSPDELGLRPRSARPYQCTAEHLVAQQDGGKDVADNIVAACRLFNLRRHKLITSAPAAEAYLAKVRRRVAKGKWYPPGFLRAVSASPSLGTRR